MPRERFPAGLRLPSNKPAAAAMSLVELPPPPRLVLALDQGSGSVLEPVVSPGVAVCHGALVARPRDAQGVALHAPCSGRVVALEERDAATVSLRAPTLVLENDGLETRTTGTPADPFSLDAAELVARLRDAGIAGLGGAAFPTATKLGAARARGVRHLLLNGAECEPWICCDDALMRHEAADVVLGARVLMRALDSASCTIAIEDDTPAAVAAVREALVGHGDAMDVVVVGAVYPRGAERPLITEVSGVEVPSGGLPVDAGWLCQNVATAAAVGRWARTGEPCLSRVVTVTGSGVARPVNVRARLGTPLSRLVEAAGGYVGEPLRLVAGGNMTGLALPTDEVGLSKSINCVFVATREDLGARPGAVERPCIRCGDCARVCPPGLLPQQIHRAVVAGADASAVGLGVRDCIDCGCCDYVCPSQIPLALRFREARARLSAAGSAAGRARRARERFERHERRREAEELAQRQAFAAAREQARRADPPA